MKKGILFLALMVVFFSWSNVSYAQYDFRSFFNDSINNSEDVDAGTVLALMETIAGFMMIVGGILAGIALITSGLMYMSAGSNPTRVTSARSIFKNGVIGALIIFGFGIIINTIVFFATDPFTFFN